MPTLQLVFICITFLGPPLLWLLSRQLKSRVFSEGVSWALAAALFVASVVAIVLKIRGDGKFIPGEALPMHLCDWAMIAVLFALIARSRNAFELAYCWGIAGTAQGLFTPAIEVLFNAETICFFIRHSFIPASVFWLLLDRKMRPGPGAYWRVLLWSELYLVIALLVNRFTDGNYGFLTEKPTQASLLDHFSTTRWLYIFQINLTGVVAFALLLLPWWLFSGREDRKITPSAKAGTFDA